MTYWHARPRTASRDEREQLVQKLEPLLRAREEVVFAYLHGSFITEEAFRDVDLALYVAPSLGSIQACAGMSLTSESIALPRSECRLTCAR